MCAFFCPRLIPYFLMGGQEQQSAHNITRELVVKNKTWDKKLVDAKSVVAKNVAQKVSPTGAVPWTFSKNGNRGAGGRTEMERLAGIDPFPRGRNCPNPQQNSRVVRRRTEAPRDKEGRESFRNAMAGG